MNDNELIGRIANRAQKMYRDAGIQRHLIDCMMDVDIVHRKSGLRLADLLEADNFNFSHDIGGIATHLDRRSGELKDCFVPRFSS